MTDPSSGSLTWFPFHARRRKSALRFIELLVALIGPPSTPVPMHLCFLLARWCVLVFVHIGFQIERQWQRREREAMTWLVAPVLVPVPTMALEVVQASVPAPMEESWHGDMLLC
jgi:hypothetical protein